MRLAAFTDEDLLDRINDSMLAGLEVAIGRIDAIEEDLSQSWLQGVLF